MAYAARQKQTVLIFSLEMTGAEIVGRLAVAGTGVNLFQLTTGQALQAQWPAVTIAQRPGRGADPARRHRWHCAARVRPKALRLATRVPLGLIIVDYVQLVTLGQRSEKRYQELGAISRGLKALAKELDVPILAAAQLSRAVEQRSDRKPTLADLRVSGDLEQDADTVLFIDRQDQDLDYQPAELIVAKHRHGPTGRVPLLWRRAWASFVAVAKP